MLRRPLLAAVLALCWALAAPAQAPAISGLASPGPAVGAQYPGVDAQLPDLRSDEVQARPAPTLVALGAGAVTPRRGDRGRAGLRDERPGDVVRAARAVALGPADGVLRGATVGILLAGVALLAGGRLGRPRTVRAGG